MYRWSCNRRICALHLPAADIAAGAGCRYARLLAVCLAAIVILVRGIGVEAQAAVKRDEPRQAAPAADPMLGSLSFTDSDAPVEVTASSLEFDYRARVLVYRGDVVATQDDVQLKADTLTLDLSGTEKNELRSVVAEGNVHLSKGDRQARAGRAVYDQSKRLITLSRNAVLQDDRGNVSGDTVHVYLDDSRTVIEGGSGRVRAVLRPSAGADDGDRAEVEVDGAGGQVP